MFGDSSQKDRIFSGPRCVLVGLLSFRVSQPISILHLSRIIEESP